MAPGARPDRDETNGLEFRSRGIRGPVFEWSSYSCDGGDRSRASVWVDRGPVRGRASGPRDDRLPEPSPPRAPQVLLSRGVPVFCEKPIVRTQDESIELARLLTSRSNNLPPLLVGLVLRSMPLVKEAIERIHRGDLGELVSIDATEFLPPEHGAYLARNWRRKAEWGGSFLLDKVCHDFDIFGWATRSFPRRVMSMGGLAVFKPEHAKMKRKYADGRAAYELAPGGWSCADDAFSSDMDVCGHQVALIEYENGVKLTFHANSHSAIPERRWVFIGTDAAMIVDLTRNQLSFQKSLTIDERGYSPPEPEISEFDPSIQSHITALTMPWPVTCSHR